MFSIKLLVYKCTLGFSCWNSNNKIIRSLYACVGNRWQLHKSKHTCILYIHKAGI